MQFWNATRNRLPVRGAKQFVRYPIPIIEDSTAILERLTNQRFFRLKPKLPLFSEAEAMALLLAGGVPQQGRRFCQPVWVLER